jgi:hypothetical protein
LKHIQSMIPSSLQRKHNGLIKCLQILISLLSQIIHKTEHLFSLGIPGLKLLNLILINFPLRQIDIPFILINPDDLTNVILIDFLSNQKHLLVVLGLAGSAVLGQGDHSLYVVILQKFDYYGVLVNLSDFDYDVLSFIRKLLLIKKVTLLTLIFFHL